MKPSSFSIGRLLTAAGAGAALAASSAQAFAADNIGQPTDRAIDFQPGVTHLRDQVMGFHNGILLPVLIGISLLVLALLLWCIVRFNAKANPTPARFTHNTTVEVLWTLGPVLILLLIAIPSFRLLFDYHDMPKPDLTVKATGYQWYWGYTYPDQKIDEYTSNILTEDKAKAAGAPYLLATTAPLVVPVNKTVHVLVIGADVIHSFSVPAFGIKIDAVPGRTNDTWFHANRIGTYYGQCSQLCGTDHSYMPIEVKVVSQPDFDAWVAGKTAPAAPANSTAPAPTAAATPAAPATAPVTAKS
ncbi:MAG TPA: cytochrome c oxidase subunit II [Caulobacteraceae bacterium]|nr:cytochrome c oxidase subunit II [Caulobacteraceae bacterium]